MTVTPLNRYVLWLIQSVRVWKTLDRTCMNVMDDDSSESSGERLSGLIKSWVYFNSWGGDSVASWRQALLACKRFANTRQGVDHLSQLHRSFRICPGVYVDPWDPPCLFQLSWHFVFHSWRRINIGDASVSISLAWNRYHRPRLQLLINRSNAPIIWVIVHPQGS